MSIILRNMARVTLPEDVKADVLRLFIHHRNTGEHIRTYRYKDGVAYLPPNMTKLRLVSAMIGQDIIDERSEGVPLTSPFVLNPDFKFRAHQEEPAKDLLNFVLKRQYGVLKAGCGCGKTVTMTYVSGNLNRKILILVDMGSLVTQWQEAFKLVWNREAQNITKDTTDFWDVGICTFQLLHFNPQLVTRIRQEYGCLLLDEFHSTASDTRREVLIRMDNAYRIGCTATLMKKGYQDDVLTDFVSDQFIEMVDHNEIKPDVYFVNTTTKFYSNNPDDWGKIQSGLGKDLNRNQLIAGLIVDLVNRGRKVLCVGITVDSLKQVMIHIRKHSAVKPITYVGSTSLKQDLELRDKLAKGVVNVILTVRKADKGLDLPSLDALVLARAANNQAFIQQVVGRIVRNVEGKPTPEVYDLVDDCSLAKSFARNRGRWYTKLGYNIKE